jgi:hypothetical protein
MAQHNRVSLCVPTFILLLVLGICGAPNVRGKDGHTSSSSQYTRDLPLQVGHGMPLTVPVLLQVSQEAIVWFVAIDFGQAAAYIRLVREEEEKVSVDQEGYVTDDNRVS